MIQSYCATVKINLEQRGNSIKALSLEMKHEVSSSDYKQKSLALAQGC